MGFRARWVAVQNVGLAPLLSRVGLREVSVSNEAIFDTGWYAVALPNHWMLLFGDGWDHMDDVTLEHAQALSRGTEALHFYTDDTPMSASLTSFKDGREVWALTHDVAEASVRGEAPEVVTRTLEILRAQQAQASSNVDVLYDAAAQIGLALIGFRHDQTLADAAVLPVHVLSKE